MPPFDGLSGPKACSASRTSASTARPRSPARRAIASDELVQPTRPSPTCHQRHRARAGSPASARTRRRAVPGVIDILTHDNVGERSGQAAPRPDFGDGGGTTTTPLESDQVWHDGQIIAVVRRRQLRGRARGRQQGRGELRRPRPSSHLRQPRRQPPSRTSRRARAARPEEGRRGTPPSPRCAGEDRRALFLPRPSTTTRSSCSPPPACGTGRS